MCKFRTHYDNLNVMQDATPGVIKLAYKMLSQSYHPDKFVGGSEQANYIMKLINKAYAVLSDPNKRREHDQWISEKENLFTSVQVVTKVVKHPAQKTDVEEEINQHIYWRNFAYTNNGVYTNNADAFYLSITELEKNSHSWIA